MDKKKLFIFSQGLNLFFYLVLGVSIYWYQNRILNYELIQYYNSMTTVLHSEITEKKEFYHQWFKHLYDKELSSLAQRAAFFKTYNINYVGKWTGEGQLTSLLPETKKPPFPELILQNNTNYLFHRDRNGFYFTYLMNDKSPAEAKTEKAKLHVVVQSEDSLYLIKRAALAGAQVMILEKEDGLAATSLFSNLKEAQTKEFVKKYPLLEEFPQITTLENQTFLFVPQIMYNNGVFKQVIIYAYSIKNFLFTASLGMAILLLALFCGSSYFLYYGYVKSRD